MLERTIQKDDYTLKMRNKMIVYFFIFFIRFYSHNKILIVPFCVIPHFVLMRVLLCKMWKENIAIMSSKTFDFQQYSNKHSAMFKWLVHTPLLPNPLHG